MNERGFWFALPRLLARLTGRKVRRAQWSAVEAYGLGWLVFLFPCVFFWREQLAVVRPIFWQIVLFVLIPLAVWIGWLLLYFFVWLLAGLLRQLGLFSRLTNNPLQSFFIILIVSVLALLFLRDEQFWLRSLGMFWLGLVALNFCAEVILRCSHEP
jgi:hypothetical protein